MILPRVALNRPTVSFLIAATLAFTVAACGGSSEPPSVATVAIAPSTRTLLIGPGGAESILLVASTKQANGQALSDRTVTWTTSAPSVVSVAATGFATAIAPGSAIITATSDGVTGTAQIVVQPVPVASIVLSPATDSIIIGQTRQLSAIVKDSVANTLTDRPLQWNSSAPTVAAVTSSGFITTVSVGTAVISATVEGRSGTATVVVVPSQGPLLSSVSPTVLVPGTVVTLSGTRFAATTQGNTLLVRGLAVAVLTASPTQVTFRMPCIPSGTVPLTVRTANGPGDTLGVTVAVTRRTLAVGQSLILTDENSSECNELAATGSSARFLMTVFSAATSPNTLIDVEVGGNPITSLLSSATTSLMPSVAQYVAPVARHAADAETPEAARDRAHFAHLERERQLYQEMRASGGMTTRSLSAARSSARATAPELGDMRTLYYNFNGCGDSTRIIRGKVIYAGTRSIIWEDSANTLLSSSDTQLADYYTRLGQIFDQDQYDAVRTTFGDPLLRDPLTDNDGHVHMVFTQRLNGSGAAAYVTSCDQSPRNTGTRAASNFGEFFYGNVPTVPGSNLNGTTAPDGWFYFMARTVVHEVKHIASHAARIVNNAPAFEQSWLEEGTARHAEEIWVRSALHRVPWKGNHGYGTSATNGVFCDFNPSNATCLAADPLRRPSYGMRRQINEIRPKLLDPWDWSPYGDASGQSGAVFYQTVWSLVRYAVDRYGSSDAAFLGALNNAVITGTNNLAAVAGVPLDKLIGGWGLALVADDYPGLVGADADATFATWNLRTIYAGLNADPAWNSRFNTLYPIAPAAISFGAFNAQRSAVRGGAHAYFELSGTLSAPQLLHLRGMNGGAMPSSARLAIVRVQ